VKPENDLLMACHECDALQNVAYVAEGNAAICSCCGQRLFKNLSANTDKSLALILACAILFGVANVYPIMQLSIAGIEREVNLIQSALIFYELDSPVLALVVLLSSVALPAFCIFALLYILLALHFKKSWRYTRPLLVWVSRLLPWGMMDVFLLAVLVALVKLVSFADVDLGVGFAGFIALVVCYAAAISSIEMHNLWGKLDTIHRGNSDVSRGNHG